MGDLEALVTAALMEEWLMTIAGHQAEAVLHLSALASLRQRALDLVTDGGSTIPAAVEGDLREIAFGASVDADNAIRDLYSRFLPGRQGLTVAEQLEALELGVSRVLPRILAASSPDEVADELQILAILGDWTNRFGWAPIQPSKALARAAFHVAHGDGRLSARELFEAVRSR